MEKETSKPKKMKAGEFIDRGAAALAKLFFTGDRSDLDAMGDDVKEAARDQIAERDDEKKKDGTIETTAESVSE